MIRYSGVPWPWVGFIVGLALLLQQIVLHGFAAPTTMVASFYHVGVIALLVCRRAASPISSASWSASH
jgi:hypothetical protein